MQQPHLMQYENCRYSSSWWIDCQNSPVGCCCSATSSRMMNGFAATCASNIGTRSGTRSRMVLKFGSGATVTRLVPSSDTCVLQASRGRPLMNMPQDPQTPMRQDDRHASEGDRVSLMT